jgi:hypothetical protein
VANEKREAEADFEPRLKNAITAFLLFLMLSGFLYYLFK